MCKRAFVLLLRLIPTLSGMQVLIQLGLMLSDCAESGVAYAFRGIYIRSFGMSLKSLRTSLLTSLEMATNAQSQVFPGCF
jgi:hypothetical protein